MSLPVLTSAAGLSGIFTHLLCFIRGDWEPRVTAIPTVYAAAEAVFLAYTVSAFGPYSVNTLFHFILLNVCHFTGLFASILLYRAFFHRLRNFPGPFPARLSTSWSAYMTLLDFRFGIRLQGLHQQYGDLVRIRPREISICHVDAVQDIHGPGTVCVKGPMYDINLPARSLQMTRDKAFHSRRRRAWDRAFTTSALSEFQPKVLEHCLDLVAQLSARIDQPVNFTSWMKYFSFDVMGDLAFGKSFNMVQTEGDHFILGLFADMQPFLAVSACMPWFFIVLKNLPIVNQKRAWFVNWCSQQVQERQKMGKSRRDLFSYILGDAGNGQNTAVEITQQDLEFDSELAIVAGSDTTSSVMTATIYLLARHPEKLHQLQAEIDQLVPPVDPLSYQSLIKDAPFLHACINETLRLYPAVPAGVPRLTPSSGAIIAGTWIPGDTVVSTPTYALHRDSRYFGQPEKFIPERWTSQPELIYNKDAYSPFLVGSYSCVGKNLAWMEMRLLMYYMVKNFSFRFAPGTEKGVDHLFDGADGFKDFFTARPPGVNLVFSRRG
ncbi:hypothetical protein FE257_012030 [Aspergillus nanangensis]|uniref:Cytochrome P450 n=1 Tax=Aspergillus nanangensis TaxID=2582783 RepID=A0AAD4CGM2_ASPNN|nr:hypothetical protein FE257_012030 [Aspergillus nanangensis]